MAFQWQHVAMAVTVLWQAVFERIQSQKLLILLDKQLQGRDIQTTEENVVLWNARGVAVMQLCCNWPRCLLL